MTDHKWYIVHTQSGKEFAAKEALERKIKNENCEHISEVFVPIYKETVYKDGKKKVVTRKSFPGYIYIKLFLSRDTMKFCTETPFISQFVSQGENPPLPLDEKDVHGLQNKSESNVDTGTVQIDFEVGQKALIIDGPFNNFHGTIKAIYPDKRKVCINVEIFGRTTPVEIDYFKVKRN